MTQPRHVTPVPRAPGVASPHRRSSPGVEVSPSAGPAHVPPIASAQQPVHAQRSGGTPWTGWRRGPRGRVRRPRPAPRRARRAGQRHRAFRTGRPGHPSAPIPPRPDPDLTARSGAGPGRTSLCACSNESLGRPLRPCGSPAPFQRGEAPDRRPRPPSPSASGPAREQADHARDRASPR